MAHSNQMKQDFAWKTLLNRAMTYSGKAFFEEAIPLNPVVHANNIWKDTINSDPAVAVTAGVAQQETLLVLEEDPTVPGKRAWIARDGNGDRLTGWIPPSFGQGYTVQLFDQDDNQIFTTDPINWLFIYQAGVLLMENTHPTATGFKINGYRYIGETGVGAGGNGDTKKYLHPITASTTELTLSNLDTLVNTPGCTIQVYETVAGENEQVGAQIKFSSDWKSVVISMEEAISQGYVVITG